MAAFFSRKHVVEQFRSWSTPIGGSQSGFSLRKSHVERIFAVSSASGSALAALLLCSVAAWPQDAQHRRPRTGPPPAAQTMLGKRTADSYAIYSLLMPGVPFSSMSQDQASHLAISGTTVNLDEMNPAVAPDSELRPPPNNPKGFQEAVQDFRTRRFERVQLSDAFHLDRPYKLVDAGEVAELRKVLGGVDPGSELQDKWAGYPGITFFSEVYFDSAQKAALVYMNNFCANLCSNGQWIYLEKRDGQWVRRSGLNT